MKYCLRYFLQFSWFYRCATLATMTAVGYFSLVPPQLVLVPTLWDKAQHFIAYFVLALGGYFSRVEAFGFYRVMTFLVVYGFALEVAQAFTPERVFDWLDVLANSIGVIAGMRIARLADSFIR